MTEPAHDSANEHTLSHAAVRVVFFRRADRYAHRLELAASSFPLLESVEGAHDAQWPPSPPMQELHLHPSSNAAAVLLGVGMAGSSHWSLSAELQENAAHVVAVKFDVACRTVGPTPWLGSRYRLRSEGVFSGDLKGSRIRYPKSPVELRIESPNCRVEFDANELSITPLDDVGEVKRTVRWQYTLEVLGI